MQAAIYMDFERGERGSTAEHLDVLDYKIQQEQVAVTKQAVATFAELDGITKPKAFGKMEVAVQDWKAVSVLAKRGVTVDSEIANLNKELVAAQWDA